MSRARGEGLRRIEQEIAGEKAAALGRVGDRLEAALAEVRATGARVLEAPDEIERRRLADEYAAARRRALDARLALLIQREALGLRRHTTVYQQFPEPPPIDELLRRTHGFPRHR